MPDELPNGSVTLLFTDIEGSTRLLNELGAQAYEEALAEHRRLLRAAFTRRGGVEVDTQGDAFFYAFASAPAALAAARNGQEALSAGPVRVRMGLHTGSPHRGREGYVGADVHLAARIAAAGHGGQVLLSQATRALVEGELADLGEHRLKDFAEPLWLFQLGSERFPPLRTISNTNLPRPASSFVGRERELAEVVELLREGARLLTLSGPGWLGQDAARARGGGRAGAAVPKRRLLGRARGAARFGPRRRDRRPDPGGQGRPGRAHRRARAAPAARQLRAGGRGGAGARLAARIVPQPPCPGDEPRALAHPR